MKQNVTLITAVSIVVTNMIGTGILTTPGVLSSYLTSTGQVMMVWIAGGIIALLGAVVYGQMGSLMPHSGGEFHYLSRIYHPKLGMAAGWVSVIAGFAGPIALSAMAFAKYMMNLPFVHQLFSNTFSIDIREKIITDLDRGGTLIKAEGMYKGSEKKVIFTNVNRRELAMLQEY